MTAASLGVGLAKQGKRVLLIDADAQHSLTISFGVKEPDKLPVTLSTLMSNIISRTDFAPETGIIHHADGVDILPSNNTLAGMEFALVQQIGRESVLKRYIDRVKPHYEYIIVDCAPSLDLLTINALAAADSVIIPLCPKYLDAKGLELLLNSISQIQEEINPNLSISANQRKKPGAYRDPNRLHHKQYRLAL